MSLRKQLVCETKLTGAEIAKTTIEANSSALLIFPGTVHCEPHEHISWAEYPYVIDDGGDIYFRVPDDANIMHDPEATNAVNQQLSIPMGHISDNSVDDITFFDDYYEDEGADMLADFTEWNILIDSAGVHPIYFAKCLTKAANMEYARKMDHPSNGVSVLGCLSPAYVDEDFYLRRLFSIEDGDSYDRNWKHEDVNFNASLFYRLEIMRIELFSVYGVQVNESIDDVNKQNNQEWREYQKNTTKSWFRKLPLEPKYRLFYDCTGKVTGGKILSRAFFKDLDCFVVRRENNLDYFKHATDFKTTVL
ncbi:uncharacterized protein At3g49140-like [Rutidosis leptorrhynchoides]|uniref:uncharacterized protein At3g49140-like n=1 Tax=Rutidosis leptorrhynchoides TaxID=125765 RepID=UPI003A9A452C